MWSTKIASLLNVRSDKESVSPKIKFLKFHLLGYKIRIISLNNHFQISSYPPPKPLSENISPTTYKKEPLKPHGRK